MSKKLSFKNGFVVKYSKKLGKPNIFEDQVTGLTHVFFPNKGLVILGSKTANLHLKAEGKVRVFKDGLCVASQENKKNKGNDLLVEAKDGAKISNIKQSSNTNANMSIKARGGSNISGVIQISE